MSKPAFVRKSKVEQHLHVYLFSPDKKEFTAHTIVYVNKQWILIPGIHVKAQRTFKMLPKDGVEYQKRLFTAYKANSNKAWKEFSKWYKTWKETVSVKS